MPKPRTKSTPQDENAFQPIANHMAQLRKLKGWTQGELAEKIGLSRNLLASIESGRTNINAVTVIRWAQALEVSTDELLGIEKKGSNSSPEHDLSVSVKMMQRMLGISRLPRQEQAALLKTIDMFLTVSEQASGGPQTLGPQGKDAATETPRRV